MKLLEKNKTIDLKKKLFLLQISKKQKNYFLDYKRLISRRENNKINNNCSNNNHYYNNSNHSNYLILIKMKFNKIK